MKVTRKTAALIDASTGVGGGAASFGDTIRVTVGVVTEEASVPLRHCQHS